MVGSTTNLFVTGDFTSAGGIAVTNIARWDGAQWHSMGYAPPPNSPLTGESSIDAVTTKGEELFICERTVDYDFPRGVIRLKKWANGSWTDLGGSLHLTGMQPTVWPIQSIVCIGTNVFISGQFLINELSAINIVRWDGTTWSAVAHPFDSNPLDSNIGMGPMISDGTNLFTALQSTMGSSAEVKLAKWNGTHWKILGTGVAFSPFWPHVSSLAIRGRDLFIGGNFNSAGGKPADFLALWHDFPEVTLTGRGWQPNGHFGLSIHGSQGQLVQVQSSTNLQNWLNLETQLPDSNQHDFEDATSTETLQRFYRLQLIP